MSWRHWNFCKNQSRSQGLIFSLMPSKKPWGRACCQNCSWTVYVAKFWPTSRLRCICFIGYFGNRGYEKIFLKIQIRRASEFLSLTHWNRRLLGASSWMNWIVNEHGCKLVPLLLNFVIKFRYCWQPNVEDYHLCIYSNSGRLEKHSVLKFICFKLLGHCNIFTFRKGSSLVFFLYFMTFSVCWLNDRSCLHSLAFDFWHLPFGIQCRFWKAFRISSAFFGNFLASL